MDVLVRQGIDTRKIVDYFTRNVEKRLIAANRLI
jgi:hypothetical protein